MTRRISFLLVGLSLASAAFARDEYTRTFDKTIPVHAGVRVLLEHKLGDVTIHTHASSDVIIHADIRVSARGQQDAKAFADRIDILVDSSASVLSIRTRYPEQSNSFLGMNNTSYSVRYDLTVPESTPLDVHNSFGAVSVSGVKASSNITNSHGDLIFRDGQGTQRLDNSFARIEVSNNVGDVTVEGSNGAVDVKDVNGAISIRNRFASVTVAHASKGVRVVNSNGAVLITDSGGSGNVKNSFGEVRATTFHGDLTVNNSNGRVEATDVDGASELNTSFGEVRFSNIGHQLSVRSNNGKVEGSRVGGSVNVVNSFGQVTVRDVQGSAHIESGNSGVSISGIKEEARVKTSFGMVDAKDIGGLLIVENSNGGVKASNVKGAQINTSFGAVVLDGVNGSIQVENQNGAVDATSTLQGGCQPITIRTSFSTVRVRLSSDASYKVEARTSFGKIRSDFPINVMGSMSSDQLNGTIGSGRCEMRLTDNNGAIEILKH
jgi:hypothetical protein